MSKKAGMIKKWALNILPTLLILSFCMIYIANEYNLYEPEVDNSLEKKFYVINLDRHKARFEGTKNQADIHGIELERFSATDGYKIVIQDVKTNQKFTGKDLVDKRFSFMEDNKYKIFCSPEDKEHKYIYSTYPLGSIHNYLFSAGELGLMCSSFLLWERIASDPKSHIAVIFEDDVEFYDNFGSNMSNILTHLPKKWDLIYIDAVLKPFSGELEKENDLLFKITPDITSAGAYAYIINQRSARILLDRYQNLTALTVDQLFAALIKGNRLKAFLSRIKMAGVRDIPSELDKMGRISPNELKIH